MVIPTPEIDWVGLAPSRILLGAGALALLAAVLVPERVRSGVSAGIAALGFAAALGAAAYLYWRTPEARGLIADAASRDRLGSLAQILIAGAGLLTVGIAISDRPAREHVAEYYALLAVVASGMVFFVSANDLITLFLGLEWFSLGLYVLCAIDTDRETSLESGLKYLIVGSFGSAILLFGFALTYGASGAIELAAIGEALGGEVANDPMVLVALAMVLTGLGFKASAAPFHMWTPDVYQGAPTPITAFMSAATKVAALVVALRVLLTAFPQQAELWTWAVAAIAVASLAIGNLAALVQRDVKRLFAYSSVSHAGFLLIPLATGTELGARAVLYYLIPYAAASIGAFAVVAARERELNAPATLDSLAGMGWERPFLGVSLAFFAFAFIGLPPGGLFLGKLYAFAAAVERDWIWLVIVGVVATAISVYYYLAIIRALYMRSEPEAEVTLRPAVAAGGSPPRAIALSLTVGTCVVVLVGSLVLASPLIELAQNAADVLPFAGGGEGDG